MFAEQDLAVIGMLNEQGDGARVQAGSPQA